MKKVLVFGTFDGLHPGHLNFFEQARKHGDYLVVVVARNTTVEKIKNHQPIFDEKERLKAVKDCNLVDEAKLGYGDEASPHLHHRFPTKCRKISVLEDPYEVVREIKPDVICLGYDQRFFVKELPEVLKKMKLSPKIFRLKPYKSKIFHTSKLNKKEVL